MSFFQYLTGVTSTLLAGNRIQAPWVLITVILSTAIALVFFTFIYRLWIHPLSAFPGPRLLAMTSFYEQYHGNIKGTWLRKVSQLHREYGPVVRIGPNRLAIDGSIGWPRIFAHRSGRECEKDQRYLYPGAELSLASAPQELHRRQRKHMAPAFNEFGLTEHQETINGYIELLLCQLEKETEREKPVDMVQWIDFAIFDMAGDFTWGESFHNLDSDDHPQWILHSNATEGAKGLGMLRFVQWYPALRPLLLAWKGQSSMATEEGNRDWSMIKAEARMDIGVQREDGKRDLMSYMMSKDRDGCTVMSKQEILLNSPFVFGAGSETVATALEAWVFYLGQTPRAYERLADEIRQTFRSEGDINPRSLAHLPYLNACIEEALRLYPPAPEIPPRVCPEDGDIDGNFVPKGTSVSVYLWATFRNRDHFHDADAFWPERWLNTTHAMYDKRFSDDNRDAFKPFSHGPRDCIGKNLAYLEMRLLISRLLYRFDFELASGQSDWHGKQKYLVVWAKSPLWVRLKRREL
ncbi:putative Isotrichodermin C-15 hydroxylase [Seiridium unicorne]|uniref:Isotrichodermin C-15 hydroxylase n=1 Tax=Seiridium unicorne TaxID=138068 RepID=A0ABR2UF94_9PEZI